MSLAIQKNVDLQMCNTLGVPCIAQYLLEVDSSKILRQALVWAKEQGVSVFLLGGGSNVILPEAIQGLVVKNNIKGIELVKDENKGDSVYVRAGAGVIWHDLVQYTLDNYYYGLENLSLIPGTVGAAPMQNIGAYGVELDTIFESLTAIDRESFEQIEFDRQQCEFSYRHSVFKGSLRNRFVIVNVTLKLSKLPKLNLSYPALRDAVDSISEDKLSPRNISDIVCKIRRDKLPDPKETPNVGSFFKNPMVDKPTLERLQAQYSDLVFYSAENDLFKIAAGWLVDRAGWRGFSENGVGVHKHQALVLTNSGRCNGAAVLALAENIQADVEKRFEIRLQVEPDIISSLGQP